MRTPARNWKLGKQNVNILVLAVRWRGVAIPLLWELLDYGGSSNQGIRAELLSRALELLKPHEIRLLIADQEFIGADWLAFLTEHRVPFCLRVRSDTNVEGLPASEWLPDLKPHERGVITHEVEVMGVLVNVAVTVSAEGERVVVIGTLRAERLLDCYASRWLVETLFARVELRGFRLESSHMTRAAHVSRLIGLLTLALVWCALLGAGEERGMLVHGRAAVGGTGSCLVEVDAGVHAGGVGGGCHAPGTGGSAVLIGWYVKSQNCQVPRGLGYPTLKIYT